MTPQDYAKTYAHRFLDEFKTLIRFRSISTQTAHAPDVRSAADWLVNDMRQIGMDHVEMIDMPGGRHPLVLGEWPGAGVDAPTVMVYSHYDVQPAEISDGWQTDPFDPVERDGKIFARGATDSKIHVMAHLKAVECLLAAEEKPPVNIRLIFEGEEESGSETLEAYIRQDGDRLRSDVCVISDGSVIAPDQPSLITGLRGIVTMELHVTGPANDLHSGHFGGNVHNPAQALAEIIAKLHDESGRVTVPGFYDDVRPLDDDERAALQPVNAWIEREWQEVAAAPQSWGDLDYTLHERAGARPTLEINGIAGGYAGEGFKTVLPARALAKISCRLVVDQDPQRILAAIRDYVAQITPPTVRSEIIPLEMGAPAVVLDRSTQAMQAAARAYEKGWGVTPIYERAGGSVPIAYAVKSIADEIVMMGFAYKGGRAHGPNENAVIDMFYKGIDTAIQFYEEYAKS